jgi:hypothetical protein
MSISSSIDRFSPTCSFYFSDGRRCRMLRSPDHPEFCPYHVRKDAQARATEQFGAHIAADFAGKYTSACDLNSALAHLFTAVAQGHIKPRTANALGYLAQTMAQNLPLAQQEFTKTFGHTTWIKTIASNMYPNMEFTTKSERDLQAKSESAKIPPPKGGATT